MAEPRPEIAPRRPLSIAYMVLTAAAVGLAFFPIPLVRRAIQLIQENTQAAPPGMEGPASVSGIMLAAVGLVACVLCIGAAHLFGIAAWRLWRGKIGAAEIFAGIVALTFIPLGTVVGLWTFVEISRPRGDIPPRS